jgi:hypothetical protein
MRLTAVVIIATLLRASSAPAQDELTRDHVVIVLDASGSMKERMKTVKQDKMRVAKDALWEVLQRLPPTTYVGLVCFGGNIGKDPWVYPLGPRDDARLKAAIEQPRPDGSTPLGKFIKIGADRLLAARAAEFGYGTYRLLVVTDGEASDPAEVERHTPEVIARGITFDVIGVAMEADHTLARRVHSYRRGDDPASLGRALQEVFAEVGSGPVDETGQDAFALIAPLPDGVVEAVLKTLTLPNNDPIAQQAVPRKSPASAPGGAAAPPSAGGAPQQAPSFLHRVLRTTCLGGVLFIVVIAIGAARALGRVRRR